MLRNSLYSQWYQGKGGEQGWWYFWIKVESTIFFIFNKKGLMLYVNTVKVLKDTIYSAGNMLHVQ